MQRRPGHLKQEDDNSRCCLHLKLGSAPQPKRCCNTKPSKNQALTKLVKAQEYQDSCDRNEVEGVFGTGKTAYGLGRVAAHLKTTAFCTIGVALILMNLTKRLRSLLRLFYSWLLRIDYLLCSEAASPF